MAVKSKEVEQATPGYWKDFPKKISVEFDQAGEIKQVEIDGRQARVSKLSDGANISSIRLFALIKRNPNCFFDPRTGRLWCV